MANTLLPCPNNPFAFNDACVRASWSAFLPVLVLFILGITSIPLPTRYTASVFHTFQDFLTLKEAEELSGTQLPTEAQSVPKRKWTAAALVAAALTKIGLWIGIGILETTFHNFGIGTIPPCILVLVWCYGLVRPFSKKHIITAPMDLFWLYSFEFTGAILLLGGVLFDYGAASRTVVLMFTLNAILTIIPLIVVLRLPVGIPLRPSLPGEKEPAPEDFTSLFRLITFAWVYPLIRRGTQKDLDETDVWDLSPTMQSRPVFYKFIHLKASTLLRRLVAANSWDLIRDAFLSVISAVLTFGGPFFMNKILQILENPIEGGTRLAYLYTFLAFVCQIFKSEADAFRIFYGRRASTRMKTELMMAVYDKALKKKDFSGIIGLETKAEKAGKDTKKDDNTSEDDDPKSGAQLGKIVNLMSIDATTISAIPLYMFYLYTAPVDLGLSIYFLYRLLGWTAFSGVLFVVVLIPVNWVLATLNIKFEKGIVNARDKRTSVVNELINSIKFIKFGGAEQQWLRKANDARSVELKWLFKSRLIDIGFEATWGLLPLLISLTSFFFYTRQGNDLTVAIAFTALAVFNMITVPLGALPVLISMILQAGVALGRIRKFLDEDEVSDEVSALKSSPPEDEATELTIKNGSFKWNELEPDADDKSKSPQPEPEPLTSEPRFELRDVSVTFPEGKLTCVVGPTASGKTALLLALLGEMTPLPGTYSKPPKSAKVDENGLMQCISYASQTPWLQHASIRENIIFGYPFDEERYESVLMACALKPDLEMLADGDQTEIGVRGVSLSGGQKARVALARAVYAWTRYVLLDDPLSAVDSHTARVLFDQLFCGPLLKNRTVVLVTHHLDLLLSSRDGLGAQYIVRMLDGRIDAQGSVQDLRARGLLEAIKSDSSEKPATAAEEETPVGEEKPATTQTPKKLVDDEEKPVGDVQWRIYKTYLRASSYITWILVVLLIVATQLVSLGQKLWIKVWGEAYPTSSLFNAFASGLVLSESGHQVVLHPALLSASTFAPPSGLPSAQENPMFYVAIYGLIGLGASVVSTLLTAATAFGSLRASRILFQDLLNRLIHSTFRWFDTTPKGRILNRIGKDVSTIDNSLSRSLSIFTHTLATLIISILTIAVIFPAFLGPGLLLSFAYYKISVGYLHASRDLRRLEANTRSPIFSGFSELLEGITVVRAFGVEKRFLNEMYDKVDRTTRLGYSFWQANRWLLLNFDYLGAGAIFFTSILSVSSFVPAGFAGICITSAMTFSQMSYYACRFYTELQVELNAVERVVEYLEIPQEPPAVIESNRPPAYWPSSTSNNDMIVVDQLEVKYAPDLPSILHKISFTLKARERVGLLGRTGSGKSTLATSLLRFVEPSGGRILVDGIDISTIGVNDLRTRLTFIPQDASLYAGTIRDNLNPSGEYDDAECEAALYRVHLLSRSAHQSQTTTARASPVAELEGDAPSVSGVSSITELDPKPAISLDSPVSAEGANFSHGQRQLLALARALLRQSSVIILDEATSSVDLKMDEKIQITIREEFKDSLLLTIAHRIRTVIDYDRLIVLDQGRIAEFDTPYNLIHKNDGIFRGMCLKSGAFAELEAAAAGRPSTSESHV